MKPQRWPAVGRPKSLSLSRPSHAISIPHTHMRAGGARHLFQMTWLAPPPHFITARHKSWALLHAAIRAICGRSPLWWNHQRRVCHLPLQQASAQHCSGHVGDRPLLFYLFRPELRWHCQNTFAPVEACLAKWGPFRFLPKIIPCKFVSLQHSN